MKNFLLAVLSIVLIAAAARAQDLASLEKNGSGKRALTYFAALNSGDDAKLTAFFNDNLDSEALKRRPAAPRVEFHKQVHSDFKQLAVKRVVAVNEREINVLAQSSSGEWASVTFEIEGAEGKFAGVRVERAQPPDDKPVPTAIAPATRSELISGTDRLFGDLAKSDAFSGVVMIAKGDEPILTKAYGLSEIEKKAPNNPDTKFNLGSINKIFTRIAIGQLVSQGKLSFDDKLIKILPDYPNKDAAAKITIGNLVNMTSGIGDFFNEKFENADKKKIRSLKDYLPLFGSDPLEFEPGTKNRYSNGGYLVLGLVIEKLTGKTYYDYVREAIFKPAGMTNTDSYMIDSLPVNTAIGYLSDSGKGRTKNEPSQPARGSSAGGGYSTAADLLKFAAALRSKKLEIPDDKGGFPAEFKGTGIAGGSPGVNALFIANGQTGYTIIVLSNYDPPSAERPGMQVRDWVKNIKE